MVGTSHQSPVTDQEDEISLLDLAWLERVLTRPERVEPSEGHPELRHALGRIPEHGDRVLRVIYNAEVDPVRVVTVYFDRKLRDKL